MSRLRRLAPIVLVAFFSSLPAGADPHPAEERGFSLEKAFHISDIDSINPFNGNLLITLGLQTYEVSPHLAYSFVLTHNGNLWETQLRQQAAPCDPELGCASYTQMLPESYSNSGFGWLLSLGSLHPPFGDSTNATGRWLFRDTDASEHTFEPTLHEGETPSAGVLFSRDNSYLRLRLMSATDRRIERPDGTLYFFDGQGRLTRMEDRFGNSMSVTLGAAGAPWTVTDSVGRSHTIHFEGPGQRVSSLVLAAFNGNTATYSLGYTSAEVVRDCRHGDPELGNEVVVELLTSIHLPDGSQYSMPDEDYVTTDCAESGRMRRMRLPTLGYVSWTYGYYTFPSDRPYWEVTSEGAPPAYIWWEDSVGVKSRTLLNASGQAVGTWTYETELETGPAVEDSRQLRNTVTDPLGNRTEHYFSVYASQLPNPPWQAGDYGLPFTRYVTDATGTRYLSTRVYSPSGALVRSSFAAYDRDPAPTPDLVPFWNANRRLRSSRTVYHDDGDRYAEVTYSDFDGLNHYRTTTLGGSFGAADARTTVTGYNPTRGTFPGSFVMLAPGDPWVLETFDHQRVIEGGVTSHRVDFCFNASTGFLDRRRTRKSAGTTGAGDVLVLYQPTTQGQVAQERHYGGDLQNLAGGDACSLALPASPLYRQDHTFQFGMLQTSQYFTPGGSPMPYFHVHRDIDPSTGLVKASRDPSGLKTDFLYDALGRMTGERAAAGHDGWVQYVYTRATSATARAKVEVIRRANGSTAGTALARRMVEFDAFGRPTLESRLLPNGTLQSRETLYNALGWKTSESEWGNTAKRTQYLFFDPFGRPGTVRPPDGSAHDVAYAYFGDREVRRTVRVGTTWNGTAVTESPFATVERYDRQGRLWQVMEPSGPGNANVTTTYSYDAGGRLARASTTASGTTQNRWFSYDERGFLRSEQHPEKGTGGNGLVQYSNHDPLGLPRSKLDGPFDLRHTYDAAGRLTHVREPAFGDRLVQHFIYATANSGSNLRLGRLQSATRYNYVSVGATSYVAQVREIYVYAGRGGRVSQRDTNFTLDGVPRESFYTTWTYNDLGLVASIDYPRCQAGGCAEPGVPDVARTVAYTYTNGWLTAVGGSATYASSISYHPNGTVDTITHGNGVTWTQGMDANWMQRPAHFLTAGALAPGGAAANWNSGSYAFDGSGNLTQAGSSHFLYDGVSRIKRASVWTGRIASVGEARVQDFTFDAFGNLTSIVGSSGAPGRAIPVSSATNRLTGAVNAYDAAGNLTLWNGAATYGYGPFGDIGSMTSGGEDWRYLYNADGERFWSFRLAGGGHWALRDLDGRVLRVFSGGNWAVERDYVYRQGQLLAAHTSDPSPGHLLHYHNDHLGTPRFLTRADKVFTAFHAYYPFGEEATAFDQDAEKMKLTGHERDLNSPASPADDLDYMHARHYNPQLGRFLSVDPAIDSRNSRAPQSWNRFSYVRNNPLTLFDPDGEKPFGFGWLARAFGADAHPIHDTMTGIAKNLDSFMVVSLAGAGLLQAVPHSMAAAAVRFPVIFAQGTSVAAGLAGVGVALPGGRVSFQVAASAEQKLSSVAGRFGTSSEGLLSSALQAGKGFIDKLNGGNINIFLARPDGKAGFVRITLDPTGRKIISAGINQARDVLNGVANGRFETIPE